MKTKIFLDFDGTLFDTKMLKEEMFDILYNVGFTHDEIIGSYKAECAGGLFSRDHFIDRLAELKQFDVIQVKSKISDLIDHASKYLFPDTIKFLESIDREKFELNILTLGVPDYQREKVEHTGISGYFDNIYYVAREKWEILDQYVAGDENFIFLDDREDTVANVSKEFSSSLAICIDRRDEDTDDPMRQKKSPGIPKIRKLEDMYLLINKSEHK